MSTVTKFQFAVAVEVGPKTDDRSSESDDSNLGNTNPVISSLLDTLEWWHSYYIISYQVDRPWSSSQLLLSS
jgi:hypothetical protein